MSNLNDTDLFIVERSGVQYKVEADSMSTLQDTDLLLVSRAGDNYQLTGGDFKASVERQPVFSTLTVSQTPKVNRFTSESFQITPTYAQAGVPDGDISLIATVSGSFPTGSSAPASGVVESSEILNITQPEKGHYWIKLDNAAAWDNISLGAYEYGKWYQNQYTSQGFWPDARVQFGSNLTFTNYNNQWDTSDSSYSITGALSGASYVNNNSGDFTSGYTGMLHTNVFQMRIRYGHGTNNLTYVTSAGGLTAGSSSTVTNAGNNSNFTMAITDGAVANWNHYLGGSDQPYGRSRQVLAFSYLDGSIERKLRYPTSTSEAILGGEVTTPETISSVTTTDVIYVDTSTVATGVSNSTAVGGVQFSGHSFDDINNPRTNSNQRGYTSDGQFLSAFDGDPTTSHRFYANAAENEQSYSISISNILCRYYRGDHVSIKTADSQRVQDGNRVYRIFTFNDSDASPVANSSTISVAKSSINDGWIEGYTQDGTVDWGCFANKTGASWMSRFQFRVQNNRNNSSNNYWRCYGFLINGYMLRNVSGATKLTISGNNTHIRIGDTISPTSDPSITGVVCRRDEDNTITLDQVVGDWSSVSGDTITWTPPTQIVTFNECNVDADKIRVRDCPREPVPGQTITGANAPEFSTEMYCVFDSTGAITDLTTDPQSAVVMDSTTPTLSFPASLPDGVPDNVLPAGTALAIKAIGANAAGSDEIIKVVIP